MSLRDVVPDASVIDAAFKLQIEDAKGAKVEFGLLFAQQKTIIVFIRHFFCGAYVQQLANIPEAALQSAGTKIVVIGCGEWKAIEHYAELTGFRRPLYADSSRKLYHTLGMDIQTLAKTPSGQKKASYITMSGLQNAWESIKSGPFARPALIGKQGNMSQLGGDFVFGPGNECSFAHRMQHTEDHVEVADLMKAAGVVLP